MDLLTLIIQIILTIPLTIMLNILENKENRSINYILIPSIYIIILSALFPTIKNNIFLIVVFEIFIRNFYITSVISKENKISNTVFIIESVVSIALSLFTYNYFINQVDTVIPNPSDIKPLLWFLIILYISHLYNELTKERKISLKNKDLKIKKEQIIVQYAKFKNQYAKFIKSKNNNINNLIYSIMIYNEYTKPKIYRNIISYIGAITKRETEYGIMRIKSYSHLTDEESIKLTISNFEKILKNTKLKEQDQINKILNNYNIKEQDQIKEIYKEIIEFNKI